MTASKPVVAAFDLDGTLAARDTLVPFLRMAVGDGRVAAALARGVPRFVRAKLDRDLRDAAKEALLVATIGGERFDVLRDAADRYAPTVPLHDAIVARLRDHQLRGHETVVISASPALYVNTIASRLGIGHVVATNLEVLRGVVTGRFDGANCRAEEKRRRLDVHLAGRDVELHAYGNSPDDDLMLARADVATYV